jgi:glycosyltransferase involved in cell wall biosynthesis
MKKKKILLHSNYYKAFTGFGKHTKNLLKYLYETQKYEIVHFANGKPWSDPSLANSPWPTFGSLPDDPARLAALNRDPNLGRAAGYGGEMIDEIIKKEKPDIYMGIEDIWAFGGYWDKPWWNKVSSMVWTTLDSLPILPDAVANAPKIKNYYVWAPFAEKALNDLGHEHVKTLRGSLDTSHFFPIEEDAKFRLRSNHGLTTSDFIIGFVFRNQLRKSVPNLLDGFKEFTRRNPSASAKLLLHTHWSEGWDIPRLLEEKGINPALVLTTYFCKNCKQYEIKPFSGQGQNCKFCGGQGTQETTNVAHGVNESQLNEIYNLMDVYCHPFTSGGQEIPVQEAKLTELITLVTNYSCGEDSCTPQSGGFPLDWSEYREPGTQFIKASTSPNSIAKQLTKVFLMKPAKRQELQKKARQFVVDNYSIEVIGKKVEEIVDSLPFCDWDFDFTEPPQNPHYMPPDIQDDAKWLIDLYTNILNRADVDELDDGHKHWMEQIKQGRPRDQIVGYFRQVAAQHNAKSQPQADFGSLLDADDQGKRLLIAVEKDETDILHASALLKSLSSLYPDYNIYFATRPEFFELLDGNPYIHKVISYLPQMENLLFLEGAGDQEGFFEIAFLPTIGSQKILSYPHNAKDKIAYDLCM